MSACGFPLENKYRGKVISDVKGHVCVMFFVSEGRGGEMGGNSNF